MIPSYIKHREVPHKDQNGFTILELIIIVSIVAILATIAAPKLQGYNDKARLSEAILLATTCKIAITENVRFSGASLPTAGNWGCESNNATKYVSQIATIGVGVIAVSVQGLTTSNTMGNILTLTPQINGINLSVTDLNTEITSWACSSTAADGTQNGNNIQTLVPSSCR